MAAPHLLTPPARTYECSTCGHRTRIDPAKLPEGTVAAAPTHACPELSGVLVPMQEAGRHGILGERHHHKIVERGDYVGGEQVRYRDGVMAVESHRADGSNDTMVFAPTANGRGTVND